jgi:glycosyltransferase 2 family protein
MQRGARWLAFVATLFVSALFGYLAVRNVDWTSTWRAFGRTNYWWLIPTLAMLAVWTLIRAVRWQSFFRHDARPGLGAVTKATIVGLFFNNILPARAGEAARVVALRSYSGTHVAESSGTVVVERLFDVLGLFTLLFLFSPWLPRVKWLHAAALVALAAVGLMVVLIGLAAPLERRAVRSSHRFAQQLASLVHGLAAVRHPGQAAVALGWTFASWVVLGVAFWFLAIGFHLDLSLLAGMLVAIGVGLSFLVPAAPAGLGVFEAAGLAAAGAYGISSSRALAYVLVLHAVNLVPFLIAGLVVLGASAPKLRRRTAVKSPPGTI